MRPDAGSDLGAKERSDINVGLGTGKGPARIADSDVEGGPASDASPESYSVKPLRMAKPQKELQ